MTQAPQGAFEQLRRTADSFERFVPHNFLEVVAPDGIDNLKVGTSVRRSLTILFCDIRGYTSISDRVDPERMFEFINDYLAHMGRAISGAGGFVDKFIGDAIMALFEEPRRAVAASLDMRAALARFNAELAQRGWSPIEIGIGIHFGEVIMGTVGFVSRIDSTVIGDAVNVASRVEHLTKNYHQPILVTQSVADAVAPDGGFTLRLVDDTVQLRGKREPMKLYALTAGAERSGASQ